jgi:hypothetical protein
MWKWTKKILSWIGFMFLGWLIAAIEMATYMTKTCHFIDLDTFTKITCMWQVPN